MAKPNYLIQLFIPANYNNGKDIPRPVFAKIKRELTNKFGGLTAFTQSPAEGFWEDKSKLSHDRIFVFEVMAEELNRKWWQKYKETLEELLQQEEIIIRAQQVSVL